MKTQKWIVGATFSAVVASFSFVAAAEEPTSPAPATAGSTAKPKPAANHDEEGPFAPKGKTGKLREQEEEDLAMKNTEPEVVETAKRGSAALDAVIGFGKTGTLAEPTSITALSFVAHGNYLVNDELQLGLRVPFSTANIQVSGSEAYNAAALGNLALVATYVAMRDIHTALPIELTLGAPTAMGDAFGGIDTASQRQYQVNQAAMVARAYESDELFEPHRFSLVPGVGYDYHRGAVRAGAFTRLPVLIKAGGQEPETNVNLKINSVALEWIVGGQGYYNVISKRLDLGLRAWMAYLIMDAIEPTGENAGPTKVQFVLEPSAVVKFDALRIGAGFLWPVAGRLASDVKMNGFRLTAAYLF